MKVISWASISHDQMLYSLLWLEHRWSQLHRRISWSRWFLGLSFITIKGCTAFRGLNYFLISKHLFPYRMMLSGAGNLMNSVLNDGESPIISFDPSKHRNEDHILALERSVWQDSTFRWIALFLTSLQCLTERRTLWRLSPLTLLSHWTFPKASSILWTTSITRC